MDEKPVDELALPRAARTFRESAIGAIELSYKVPQCKLVQDFLAAHGLPWQAFHMLFTFSREQQRELGVRLQALHDRVEGERARPCLLYGVANENELPHERRVLFDAALRAFIEREDHYS